MITSTQLNILHNVLKIFNPEKRRKYDMDKLSRAVKVGEKSEEDLRDKLVLNKVLDEVKFLINESKQILKILSNAD